ncbi:hypothetical protein Pyn_17725 [Prunus yedoensis var. nudiflora]|uniref:Uncharacterized protein n=1 Tax=Prunus yedoensis var. nudiflora TaxID=2094558 RepID=A0A314UFW4_PRUYE|nr:hypothetical protein Pyn_17725 [Prunus yedoensis var. nudiflora]
MRPLWHTICCNNPLCSSWNAIRSCIKKIHLGYWRAIRHYGNDDVSTLWEPAGRYMTALTVWWAALIAGVWLGLGFACSIFHGFLSLLSPRPQNGFRWACNISYWW